MSARFVTTLLSASSLVALTAACTINQAAPSGADGGAPSSSGAPEAPGLTCLQILQCIVDCPESDTACPDACADKGTPDGKEKVTAFATCIETEQCTDAPCVQEKCNESLTACTASSTPKTNGTALEGDAPPGSVPADLVGSWAGANFGVTERLVFNSDGTGTWQSAVTTNQTGCFSYTNTNRSGNIVISDTTITVYATTVTTQVQTCSPPADETNEAPVTEAIAYQREGTDTLKIIDNTCAAKYAGS
jgi:hypothetical protein